MMFVPVSVVSGSKDIFDDICLTSKQPNKRKINEKEERLRKHRMMRQFQTRIVSGHLHKRLRWNSILLSKLRHFWQTLKGSEVFKFCNNT